MRKHSTWLLCCVLLTAFLAWQACRGCRPVELPATTPQGAGLLWKECAVEEPYSWPQAEACFGHAMPLWNDEERARYGQRVRSEDWRLTIGEDTYETATGVGLEVLGTRYTLFRNGNPVASLRGEFLAHSPNISLQNVGGRVAWEFADHRVDTVVYDRQDLRRTYGLSAAYRPYGLGDRLIFVGKCDDKYLVVYGGNRSVPSLTKSRSPTAANLCCGRCRVGRIATCSGAAARGSPTWWKSRADRRSRCTQHSRSPDSLLLSRLIPSPE